MSIEVQINAGQLLMVKGVEVRAELNIGQQEAIEAYRGSPFGLDYVRARACLEPVLLIKLPGYPHTREIGLIEDQISFSCGSQSQALKFLIGFCEAMGLKYTVIA